VLPIGVAVVVLCLDQLTKLWVTRNLTEGEAVPVVGRLLQWVFVKNPGAAFSFGVNSTWVFTLLSVAVVLFIIFQLRRIGSIPWGVFLGLLLGGTLGNLSDRLLRAPSFGNGHVIDFIYTEWMLHAIYNVADIAIVTGMGLFILITLFGLRLDGRPKRESELESSEAADADGAVNYDRDEGSDSDTDTDPGAAAQTEEGSTSGV
jgi:signal peptidase II